MRIKGMNGEEYSVTGQGQGNYNTVGASAGIASFLGLNAGNLLGGCGNVRNAGYGGPVEVITSEDRPISRYEAGMMDKISAKDSEIALLKSNTYTDQKLADVYDRCCFQWLKVTKMKANHNCNRIEPKRREAVSNGPKLLK